MTRQQLSQDRSFSVGICATGDSKHIGELLELVLADVEDIPLSLRKVVVVASACTERDFDTLRRYSLKYNCIHLIIEEGRRGKAEAINEILAQAKGDFLVLINSDALPAPGAITKLVSVIGSDNRIGTVAAKPVPSGGVGLNSLLMEFMWTAHNDCSLALNHLNISNHTTDELVVLRSSAVNSLPSGLVNDGAYLAGIARQRGYTIRFCEQALVKVTTPIRTVDSIRQRRRILFGHVEVWRKVGIPPKTIESLMIFSPLVGFRLIVKTIARQPKFLAVLPLAVLEEVAAGTLAMWDTIRSTGRHAVWKRYA